MMASYLRAMLTAQNAGITGHPFAELLNGVRSPAGGQLGDYVFNQEGDTHWDDFRIVTISNDIISS